MLDRKYGYKKAVWVLMGVSFAIRLLLAGITQLGNDEVYYWTYALFPDWSHFDHPLMVGLAIQLSTLNLLLEHELFLRLSAVVLGTLNIWQIYRLGTRIKDEQTGWYAALLFTSSIYCFIITGVFILPDAPQSFFWLLSLRLFWEALSVEQPQKQAGRYLLLAGLAVGLATLSKYTSLYLWFGAGLFILFWRRAWFKRAELYIAPVITLLFLLPLIYWNIQNDFISFTFHSNRVEVSEFNLRFDYFFMEFLGQLLYNNPVNWILILIAVASMFKRSTLLQGKALWFLLAQSLPLILLFLGVSLSRRTLPHWTGPGYFPLIVVGAVWLQSIQKRKVLFPLFIKVALGIMLVGIVVAVAQIRGGLFDGFFHPRDKDIREVGVTDFSLDMYGWHQLGEAFGEIHDEDIKTGDMPVEAPIISWRWFPAANQDYYVARKHNMVVLGFGKLERIHKYAWMNRARGGFTLGMDGYAITSSHDFHDPQYLYKGFFKAIIPADTVPVLRNNRVVMEYYIYHLKQMVKLPPDELFSLQNASATE